MSFLLFNQSACIWVLKVTVILAMPVRYPHPLPSLDSNVLSDVSAASDDSASSEYPASLLSLFKRQLSGVCSSAASTWIRVVSKTSLMKFNETHINVFHHVPKITPFVDSLSAKMYDIHTKI